MVEYSPRPEVPLSEELIKDFLSTQEAVKVLTCPSGSSAERDFNRAVLSRQNPNHYLIMNPSPFAPEELSREQIFCLYKLLGPDFFRLRAISPRLVEEGVFPLPIGGSCAIETFVVNKINATKDPELRREIAKTALSLAPTFTHVSGGVLAPGGEITIGVHLIEDGLWGQRIEEEYGVPNGRQLTKEAYGRIHDALERRAKLVNPQSRLIPVNFDELNLIKEPLPRWFDEIGIHFERNFGIAQVIYTYMGPELLELVKNALVVNHGLPEELIAKYNLAARLKQIDHNDWDATINQLKSVILGAEPDEKQRELLTRYPHLAGVKISQWIKENWQRIPSAASGFFDTPFNGGIMHMHGPFLGTPLGEQFVELLTSPLWLNHTNVGPHLEVLRRSYLEERSSSSHTPDSVGESKEKLKELMSQRQRLDTKIPSLEREITIREQTKSLIELLFTKGSNLEELTQKLQSITGEPSGIANKFESILKGLSHKNQCSDMQEFISLLTEVVSSEEFQKGQASARLSSDDVWDSIIAIETLRKMVAIFNINLDDREIAVVLQNQDLKFNQDLIDHAKDFYMKKEEESLGRMRDDLEKKKIERKKVEEELSSQTSGAKKSKDLLPIFPLSSNLVICYATQFIFDQDFREFLRRAAEINQIPDKERRKNEIRALIAIIFPKLEAYIRYIFEGGDYPQERFKSVFGLY